MRAVFISFLDFDFNFNFLLKAFVDLDQIAGQLTRSQI